MALTLPTIVIPLPDTVPVVVPVEKPGGFIIWLKSPSTLTFAAVHEVKKIELKISKTSEKTFTFYLSVNTGFS